MRKVIDLLPNIGKDTEVLLFSADADYTCVEHYPYGSDSQYLGSILGDVLDILELNFPHNCWRMHVRFNDMREIIVKERGNYITIIIHPLLFINKKTYEQTSPS